MEEDISNKKTKFNLFKKSSKASKEKVERDDKTNNIIFDIVAIICIIVMAIAVAPKTMQNDTYYNIKCGEYLVQNGIWGQNQDPFSWHDLSYTWPHWLFDVLIYLLYAITRKFMGSSEFI